MKYRRLWTMLRGKKKTPLKTSFLERILHFMSFTTWRLPGSHGKDLGRSGSGWGQKELLNIVKYIRFFSRTKAYSQKEKTTKVLFLMEEKHFFHSNPLYNLSVLLRRLMEKLYHLRNICEVTALRCTLPKRPKYKHKIKKCFCSPYLTTAPIVLEVFQ